MGNAVDNRDRVVSLYSSISPMISWWLECEFYCVVPNKHKKKCDWSTIEVYDNVNPGVKFVMPGSPLW